MFGIFGQNRFNFVYSNYDAPSTTPGTSVTPGATNAEGSATVIATGSNISQDCYGVYLWINAGNTSAAQKNHLLDIGIDAAGGTSYTYVVNNIQCGQSAAALNGGIHIWLPLFIKAGSQVAVRIQGSNGTAGTVRVAAKFFGQPSHPHLVRAGVYSETIGTVSGSAGTSFTPGNSGAEGTWVSLGTTTRALWYVIPTINISNATTTSLAYHIDLAWGDGTNKVPIVTNMIMVLPGTAEQTTTLLLPPGDGYCDIPASATLYVRGTCSGTAVTGFTCLAVGIGG